MRSDGIIAVVREDAETNPERPLGDQCASDIAPCASRWGIRDVEVGEVPHVEFADGEPQLFTLLIRYHNICHQWTVAGNPVLFDWFEGIFNFLERCRRNCDTASRTGRRLPRTLGHPL